jgi:hypothetical protein
MIIPGISLSLSLSISDIDNAGVVIGFCRGNHYYFT